MAIIFNGVTVAGDSAPTGSQSFTASGTWTCPTGVTKVFVHIAGGGGGGGRGPSGSSFNSGGGGSCYGYFNALTVTPGTVYTVTVGAGGAIGSTSNSSTGYGSSGGTSSFGSLLSYAGGGGGYSQYIVGSGKQSYIAGGNSNGASGTLVATSSAPSAYTQSVVPIIVVGGGSIGVFGNYTKLNGIANGTAPTPTTPGQGGVGKGYQNGDGVPSPGFRGQVDIKW